MYSMGPITRRGYAVWDRGIFPIDEFTERYAHVRSRMAAEGLGAIIVFGNMFDDADLAYLAGGHLDGAVIVSAQDEPRFISAGGSRELYFHKTLTWIERVDIAGPAGLAAALAKALQELSALDGPIGIVGRQSLSPKVNAQMSEALSQWSVHDADHLLADIRACARERETLAVRVALAIATSAVEAGETAFAAGASNAEALVEAERAARLRRAWDVRLLSNIDRPDLRPYEGASATRLSPFVLWVGVRYQGYWAETVNAHADPDGFANRALSAMESAIGTGAAAGQVAEAATKVLGDASAYALSYGLGSAIGQTPAEGPVLRPGNRETLRAGQLLTLRVAARRGDTLAMAARTVRVQDGGCERLEPFKPSWAV